MQPPASASSEPWNSSGFSLSCRSVPAKVLQSEPICSLKDVETYRYENVQKVQKSLDRKVRNVIVRGHEKLS